MEIKELVCNYNVISRHENEEAFVCNYNVIFCHESRNFLAGKKENGVKRNTKRANLFGHKPST